MTDLFRDASFFGGCEPKNSDKTDVAENSLVLVSFRISVWTGMSTEQTSVEEGAENMRRRRIVPASMLKVFSDFRVRAKALCAERGEPYLNGYVMRRCDAVSVERTLAIWCREFCRQRDEVFSPLYEKSVYDRSMGVIPKGCASDVICPSTDYVLRRISFEFDAFTLASFSGSRSSLQSFIQGLALRFAEELDLVRIAAESGAITDALLCRLETLKDRLLVWQGYREEFRDGALHLTSCISQAMRLKPYCRDKTSMLSEIEAAFKLLDAASRTEIEAEPKTAEPIAESAEPDFSMACGLEAMLARGKSLFSFS